MSARKTVEGILRNLGVREKGAFWSLETLEQGPTCPSTNSC